MKNSRRCRVAEVGRDCQVEARRRQTSAHARDAVTVRPITDVRLKTGFVSMTAIASSVPAAARTTRRQPWREFVYARPLYDHGRNSFCFTRKSRAMKCLRRAARLVEARRQLVVPRPRLVSRVVKHVCQWPWSYFKGSAAAQLPPVARRVLGESHEITSTLSAEIANYVGARCRRYDPARLYLRSRRDAVRGLNGPRGACSRGAPPTSKEIFDA